MACHVQWPCLYSEECISTAWSQNLEYMCDPNTLQSKGSTRRLRLDLPQQLSLPSWNDHILPSNSICIAMDYVPWKDATIQLGITQSMQVPHVDGRD